MVVELISREEFSENDLISVYRAFSKAYSIDVTKDDEAYLKNKGLEKLNSNFGLDYNPRDKIQFIGNRIGDIFRFYGYNSPSEPKLIEKDKTFQNLVLKYLHNKRKLRKR
jgi:hypothetical protein